MHIQALLLTHDGSPTDSFRSRSVQCAHSSFNLQLSNCSHDELLSSQVFNYKSGRHNVIEVASLTCSALDSNSAKTLAATSDPTPVRVTLDSAGVRYFACSVGDHCDEGQIIQVTTNAGADHAILRDLTQSSALQIVLQVAGAPY